MSAINNYKNVKEYRRNIKLKISAAFGNKCACCGLVDDPIVYDFHHLDPTEKEFTIAQVALSWDKVKSEATKCVMVCAHCHRKIHAGMIEVPDDRLRFDESRIPKELLKIRNKPDIIECVVCSKPTDNEKCCSNECLAISRRRVARPDRETLLREIQESSYLAVGKKYGVSDNAIRKWLKQLKD